MKTDLDFQNYWNDFVKFNEYSQVKMYRGDKDHLQLFYQYLVARSNQELKDEIKKQTGLLSSK